MNEPLKTFAVEFPATYLYLTTYKSEAGLRKQIVDAFTVVTQNRSHASLKRDAQAAGLTIGKWLNNKTACIEYLAGHAYRQSATAAQFIDLRDAAEAEVNPLLRALEHLSEAARKLRSETSRAQSYLTDVFAAIDYGRGPRPGNLAQAVADMTAAGALVDAYIEAVTAEARHLTVIGEVMRDVIAGRNDYRYFYGPVCLEPVIDREPVLHAEIEQHRAERVS